MLVYIDESGDLGFDLFKSGTSSHFVITAVVLPSLSDRKRFEKGVQRTIQNKLLRSRGKTPETELKGSKTSIEIKRYFWNQIKEIEFFIYSVAIEKRRVPPALTKDKERLYNYMARRLVDLVPLDQAGASLEVVIDKSKGSVERKAFNVYLAQHIKAKISTKVLLRIEHERSECSKGIQAADVFCWGIARKLHSGDQEWYQLFCGKIAHEVQEPIAV